MNDRTSGGTRAVAGAKCAHGLREKSFWEVEMRADKWLG